MKKWNYWKALFCLLFVGMVCVAPSVHAKEVPAELLEELKQTEPNVIPLIEVATDVSGSKVKSDFWLTAEKPCYGYAFSLEDSAYLEFATSLKKYVEEGDNVTIEIYSFDNLEKPVIARQIVKGQREISFMGVLETGVYYVFVSNDDTAFEIEGTISFQAYQVGDFVADEPGDIYIGYGMNQPIFVEIPIDTSGKMEITAAMQNGDKISGIKYAFCNEEQKFLMWGTTKQDSNYTISSYVKKGTYFMKLTPTAGKFKIRFKITPYELKNNTTKEKAKTIKRNKQNILTIPLGKEITEQHYYKFKVKKPAKLSFSIKYTGASGKVQVVLYRDEKMVPLEGTGMLELSAGKSFVYECKDENGRIEKWPAGEYLIKIGKDREQGTNGLVQFKLGK